MASPFFGATPRARRRFQASRVAAPCSARAVVARVDERRIGYLADLAPRHVPRARRELMGRLEDAAFLGSQQLDPDFERAETRRSSA